MKKALAYCEHKDGSLAKSSLEVLSNLCLWEGVESHVLLFGASSSDLDSVKEEVASYGPSFIHLGVDKELDNYSPDAAAKVIESLEKSIGFDLILASLSSKTKDFFPRVMLRLDTGMASDCTSLSLEGGDIKAVRPLYAGKCYAEVDFCDSKPAMLTLRPNALGLKNKKENINNSEVKEFSVNLEAPLAKVTEISSTSSSEKADLTGAERIVSGGRSLKSAENFKVLEELADTIGATVGASRAAVDAGYRPHKDQVGQTGKTVSPSLYMAFGISGAIQHLAGMRTSKVIVAINMDPSAPIFQKADYGIVGDLFELAPQINKEFQKLL